MDKGHMTPDSYFSAETIIFVSPITRGFGEFFVFWAVERSRDRSTHKSDYFSQISNLRTYMTDCKNMNQSL